MDELDEIIPQNINEEQIKKVLEQVYFHSPLDISKRYTKNILKISKYLENIDPANWQPYEAKMFAEIKDYLKMFNTIDLIKQFLKTANRDIVKKASTDAVHDIGD